VGDDARLVTRAAIGATGVAVILLGWALGDGDGFGDEPARLAATAALAVGLFAASGALRVPRERKEEAPWQIVTAILSLLLIALELLLFPMLDGSGTYGPFRATSDAARWGGVVLTATGLVIQNWAIVTLGRWFTLRVAVLPGHELVRSGPYRRLRHPSYTGLLMWLLGVPLAFGSWAGVVVLAVAAPFVVVRMREEETLLGREFGPPYESMRQETFRLIPYVY
jgi:protein-S-isoprenylcysteine O-methyltransferase Ste14